MTTLTIAEAEEGLYTCRATNPGGAATSYGDLIITGEGVLTSFQQKTSCLMNSVEAPPTKIEIVEEEWIVDSTEIILIGTPPVFTHEVPCLTIKPGETVLLDVAVTALPAASFMWFYEGKELK